MIKISCGNSGWFLFILVFDLNNPPRAAIKLWWRQSFPVLHQKVLHKALLVRQILKVILLQVGNSHSLASQLSVQIDFSSDWTVLPQDTCNCGYMWSQWKWQSSLFCFFISNLSSSQSVSVSIPLTLWGPCSFEPLIPVSRIIAATFRS